MNTTQDKPETISPRSAANQRIVGKLVAREVLHCASTMVSECYAAHCEHGAFPEESFENLFRGAPDYEEEGRQQGWVPIEELSFNQAAEAYEEVFGEGWNHASDNHPSHLLSDKGFFYFHPETLCGSIEENWKDLGEAENFADDARDNAPEALEHWLVSSWAARKLAERGEAVGELFDFHVWGRCTSGQAILLDSVWCSIAREMEILEGQRNSWAD